MFEKKSKKKFFLKKVLKFYKKFQILEIFKKKKFVAQKISYNLISFNL